MRRIQLELFTTGSGGLPGNDDGGTLSAWYVWSALGLYPAILGTPGVAVGSPLFASAVVHLPSGGDLRITGRGAALDAPYVQAVQLNGAAESGSWLDLASFQDGGTLEFTLRSGTS